MKRHTRDKSGIRLLVNRYREQFRIPENMNHYSETDYRKAERRYIKYALETGL